MFFIVEGEVQVIKGGTCLAKLKEGTFFGEVAVIKDTVRNAGVIATKPCNMFVLNKYHLDEAFKLYLNLI